MHTTNTAHTKSILPTLEAAANQILAVVAPTTSRLVRVTVAISNEAETASTDGAITIRMPTTFCGCNVAEKVRVAVGLLVHEVGHFLQPLAEVNSVKKQEQIPHWLANVCLDIQGEALMQTLFPTFQRPLAEVRRVVHDNCRHEYETAIARASSFAEAAGSLALWGRFLEPTLPFHVGSTVPAKADARQAHRYLLALDAFRACPARQLPERLVQLIRQFPELHRSEPPALPQGMERLQGTATGALGAILCREAAGTTGHLSGGGECAEIQQHVCHPQPPHPEAARLAGAIRSRFLSERGGMAVLAPGRFERRAAARGEIPFQMDLPGRESPAPRLVLCLDASGSMGAPCTGSQGRSKWQVAQIAAQAVALAITSAGGEVVGVVFGDGAWMAENGDAAPFSLPQSTQKQYVGSGTCFRFLVELWRCYPAHRLLVLTDGSGTPPAAILAADRNRTAAVIIPRGDIERAAVWSVRQVELNDLRHLAAVLAMLAPRSQLG